ncbi:MAG TPA: phosphatidylglycerol lysyltransferase domain-containing protein [Candidatus Saccharimonadales bacterium]|nr:phosphatidylglycerol lysyltransferase domain-containing protein [Candidatus Saccharimonadales bacterium]
MKSDSDHARHLLEKYGGGVDDFFKLWPVDKEYYFSPDGKAFLAYAVNRQVAVCLFDPVGPEKSVEALLTAFDSECRSRGRRVIFIQTTGKFAAAYRAQNWRRLRIGADAVVDVHEFTTRTVRNKYFRNIVNRFEKAGYTAERAVAPHSPKLLAELRHVSNDWLKLPRHQEWQFLTGRFDAEYLQACNLFILRRPNGRAEAFVTELPIYNGGHLGSIDLIRHRRDAAPNGIDFLLIRLIQRLERDGVAAFNLGMSPLDGWPAKKSNLDRIVWLFYRAFAGWLRFRGLHQFKNKYRPTWEPRYVWLSGSLWRIPQTGRAIFELMGHK